MPKPLGGSRLLCSKLWFDWKCTVKAQNLLHDITPTLLAKSLRRFKRRQPIDSMMNLPNLTRACLATFAAVSWANVVTASPTVEERSTLEQDPHKVLGSDTCTKCHGNELNVWKNTPHFATFRTLHRNPRAKEIARKMGLRSIKRGGICTDCHYTTQVTSSGQHRAIEGISCESCHGAAKDWIALHADYGGPQVTQATETAEHKAWRREKSISAGMNNPSNLYLIARNCYDCHTVPNEMLVNVGGHQAGSLDFELVAWSQGVVRHNFLRTGGQANGTSSTPRLRMMYVVGVLTDIEYALRATAIATQREKFAVVNANRVANMRQKLIEIHAIVEDDLLLEAIEASYSAGLKLENQAALLNAADRISAIAYRFAEARDGTTLAAIDTLLPKPQAYRYGRTSQN